MILILCSIALGLAWKCEESSDQEIVKIERNGRRLQSRGSSKAPIRIHFEYLDFDLGSEEKNNFFKEVVVPSATQFISSIVSVNPLQDPLKVPACSCGHIIPPISHQTTGVPDTDFIIYMSTRDDTSVDWAASTSACITEGDLDHPVVSNTELNAKYVSSFSFNKLFSMTVHTLTHGLGFTKRMFRQFNKDASGLKYTKDEYVIERTIRGVNKYLLRFPSLLEEARKVFDCPTLEGVELEEYSSPSYSGAHWDKRIVYTEFMVGHVTEEPIFSTLTFAVLKDSLWYDINFEYLQTPIFGNSHGCTFHETQCIVHGQAQFREFCNKDGEMCDYYHVSKGECYFTEYDNSIPYNLKYFDDPEEGGDRFADYCPIVEESAGGDCRESSNTVDPKFGETFGENSRCFMSTLLQKGYQNDSSEERPRCYEVVSCSESSAMVRFGNMETGYKTVECPFNGLKAFWPDKFEGYLDCPPYDILCSDVPCSNNCYGLGKCKKGRCECNLGRFGNDCTYEACSDIPGCKGVCDVLGKCVECKKGYFLRSGECKECEAIDNCEVNCAADGGCQECTECYQNRNGICEECENCICCEDSQYLKENKCVDCPEKCETCDKNGQCILCFFNGITSICCNSDQLYFEGICLDCPENYASPTDCSFPGHFYTSNELIQSIEFDKTFTKLIVSLKTEPTAVNIADPFNCIYYFLSDSILKLGQSPSCEFIASQKKLEVDLGYSYSLRKGDFLYLNHFHLQKSTAKIQPQFHLLFSEVRGEEYPFPVFILSAPSVANKDCKNSKLRLSSSVISGRVKDDVTFLWTVNSDLSLKPQQSTSSLLISTADLQVREYEFELTVMNMFGKISQKTAKVSVVEDRTILEVIIDAGAQIDIQVDLETFAVNCFAQICNKFTEFEFSWERVEDSDTSVRVSSSNRLVFEQGSLAEGSYTFKCLASGGGRQGSASLTVNVENSDPVAEIDLPAVSSISNGLDLLLDGSKSYDPNGKEISFQWSCHQGETTNQCTGTDENALISFENSTQDTILVDKTRLRVGDVLNVYLTVFGDRGRSSWTSSKLTVVEGGLTQINLQQISYKISTHRAFTIKLQIENGSSVNWNQLEGPELSPSSPLNLPYLEFKESIMEEGREYSYIATIESQSGESMEIVVSWKTNKGPQCDSVLKIIDQDAEYVTADISDCFDRDEDGISLFYIYGLKIDGRSIPSIPKSLFNVKTLWLAARSNILVVFVCNRMSVCIESDLEVTGLRRLHEGSLRKLHSIKPLLRRVETEDDLLPFLILQITKSFNLAKDDWHYIYCYLDPYTRRIIDENTLLGELEVSSFLGTILELTKQSSSSDQLCEVLAYVLNVIQAAEYKLRQIDKDMIQDLFRIVIKDSEFNSKIVSKILTVQRAINENLILDTLPDSEDIVIETEGYTSLVRRVFASKTMDSLEIELAAGMEISSTNLPFETNDIIDIEVIRIKESNIDVCFFKSGSYDPETIELELLDERLDINDSEYNLKLSLPYEIDLIENYYLYCLEEEKWKLDLNSTLIFKDQSVELKVTHPSIYSLQPILSETKSDLWISITYLVLMSVFAFVFSVLNLILYNRNKNNAEYANVVINESYVKDKEVNSSAMTPDCSREEAKKDKNRLEEPAVPEKASFCKLVLKHHLLFENLTYRKTSISAHSLLVWLLIMMHMNFTLIAIETLLDDTSNDNFIPAIIFISVLLCGSIIFCVQLILKKTIHCLDRKGMDCASKIIGAAVISSGYISFFFYSMSATWVVVSLLSILTDILVYQTFLSALKTKICKEPAN